MSITRSYFPSAGVRVNIASSRIKSGLMIRATQPNSERQAGGHTDAPASSRTVATGYRYNSPRITAPADTGRERPGKLLATNISAVPRGTDDDAAKRLVPHPDSPEPG